MRTRKMKTTAVSIVVLMMTTISVSAYTGHGRNNNRQYFSCTTEIVGLTQQQVEAITDLEEEHQKKMEELRTERRATNNEKSKAEIRIKMIDTRDSHRAEVKKLLTPEQQKAYEALHENGNYRAFAYNGNSHGNGRQMGCVRNGFRGNGNGYGNRTCRR